MIMPGIGSALLQVTEHRKHCVGDLFTLVECGRCGDWHAQQILQALLAIERVPPKYLFRVMTERAL